MSFERKVSQIIISSPYVSLKDGLYTMKASIRNSKDFSQLSMYAESAGKRMAKKITSENPEWKTIEWKRIPVKNGKVEIGFLANRKAGAFCHVDDVSFVKG